MDGIQVTLHEITATVKYSNTYDRRQVISCIKTYHGHAGVKSINGIALNGKTIYVGMTRDIRSLNMTEVFSFQPYGPYYEWFLFYDLLKKEDKPHE